MGDSSREKFEEAKRLNDEAVERFKRAHNDAHHRLEEAQTTEESIAIVGEALPKEREAIELQRQALDLQREAIEDSKRELNGDGAPTLMDLSEETL